MRRRAPDSSPGPKRPRVDGVNGEISSARSKARCTVEIWKAFRHESAINPVRAHAGSHAAAGHRSTPCLILQPCMLYKQAIPVSTRCRGEPPLTQACHTGSEEGLSRYNYVASTALLGQVTPVAGLVATCLFNR